MHDYFDAGPVQIPEALLPWLLIESSPDASGREPRSLPVQREADDMVRQLVFTLQQRTGDGDLLTVMREVSGTAAVDAIVHAFKLTLREAEVLYWLVKDKTNRDIGDIGDILGSSPATVKKHLERVYVKRGAETCTSAAGIAMRGCGNRRPAAGGRRTGVRLIASAVSSAQVSRAQARGTSKCPARPLGSGHRNSITGACRMERKPDEQCDLALPSPADRLRPAS